MGLTIFFDLDGTLCHGRTPFEPIFFACCAPLFAVNAHVDPPHLLRAWGAALEEPGPATMSSCLAQALDGCGAAAPRAILDRCARELSHEWARTQELNTGAEEVLATLWSRSFHVGMITNGPSDGQRAVMSALGLDTWCHWIIVSGDAYIGVRKPEPDIFLHALATSQAMAQTTWYVGDTAINDILGASRVGMRTCWLCLPLQSLPDGVPEPDSRISVLSELPEVLAH
jgi:HAD superfamily hydrolase (TIGR01549 family)